MKDLVLLPGALGASSEFSELVLLLRSEYTIHLYDFPGHGSRAQEEAHFTIEAFTADLADWLRHQNLEKADFLGYSMGGYVALYLASIAPELVGRVATLGTKLAWSAEFAAGEQKKLNPETLTAKVPQFAQLLAERHTAGKWQNVVTGTAQLMHQLGEKPLLHSEVLSSLQLPVMLGIGDQDRMVTLNETVEAYKLLPAGQLCVLPNTPHPWEKVPLRVLGELLKRFFN